MQFSVVSLFPEMFDALNAGVVGRAKAAETFQLSCWNPRDYANNRFGHVDDRPYGGGPGMVMMAEPLSKTVGAIREASTEKPYVIAMSPEGRPLDHQAAVDLAQKPHVALVCGRYEGMDERFLDQEVDELYSIGDYVLSGGELAAMVLIDAVVRWIPGVLGHADSAQQDSFMNGLLDCPHYTRPSDYAGAKVPAILQGGDHAEIARWRLKQALGRTWLRRPDLLEQREMSGEELTLLEAFKIENGYRGTS